MTKSFLTAALQNQFLSNNLEFIQLLIEAKAQPNCKELVSGKISLFILKS